MRSLIGARNATQSRCTRFRFAPLTEGQVRQQIQRVIDSERYSAGDATITKRLGDCCVGLSTLHVLMAFRVPTPSLQTTQDGIDALTRLAKGDMRKALNILQVY